MALLPVPARTITLANFLPNTQFGTVTSGGPATWPDRTALDGLDYWLDTTGVFDDEDAPGGVNVTVSPSADPDDLAVSFTMLSGVFIGLYLINGVVGTQYTIGISIRSEQGLVLSVAPLLSVIGAGTPSVPPGVLLLPSGALTLLAKPLFLPNGLMLILPPP
jgi:hypothetical protein